MYSLPSTSNRCEPSPRAMKMGCPPTLRNARTGEFTPPGIFSTARRNSSSDFVCVMRSRPRGHPVQHHHGTRSGEHGVPGGASGAAGGHGSGGMPGTNADVRVRVRLLRVAAGAGSGDDRAQLRTRARGGEPGAPHRPDVGIRAGDPDWLGEPRRPTTRKRPAGRHVRTAEQPEIQRHAECIHPQRDKPRESRGAGWRFVLTLFRAIPEPWRVHRNGARRNTEHLQPEDRSRATDRVLSAARERDQPGTDGTASEFPAKGVWSTLNRAFNPKPKAE